MDSMLGCLSDPALGAALGAGSDSWGDMSGELLHYEPKERGWEGGERERETWQHSEWGRVNGILIEEQVHSWIIFTYC